MGMGQYMANLGRKIIDITPGDIAYTRQAILVRSKAKTAAKDPFKPLSHSCRKNIVNTAEWQDAAISDSFAKGLTSSRTIEGWCRGGLKMTCGFHQ